MSRVECRLLPRLACRVGSRGGQIPAYRSSGKGTADACQRVERSSGPKEVTGRPAGRWAGKDVSEGQRSHPPSCRARMASPVF